MAALITGLAKDSPKWLAAAVVLLAIWLVLLTLAVSPSVYASFVKWLETKYEQTALRCHPLPRGLATTVDPGNIPQAPANTDTAETLAEKEDARKLFAAFAGG